MWSRMPLCLSCTFLKWHARLGFAHLRSAITNKLGCFRRRQPGGTKDAMTRQHCIGSRSSSVLRQLGFTLDEIRQLFFGFSHVAPASARWLKLSHTKLAELDNLMDSVRAVRRLLKKMMENCHCETLDQCGKGIFRSAAGDFKVKYLPPNRQHSTRGKAAKH